MTRPCAGRLCAGTEFPCWVCEGLSFMVWCVRRGWFMPPGSSVWTFGPLPYVGFGLARKRVRGSLNRRLVLGPCPSGAPGFMPHLLVAGLLVLAA